MRCIGTILCAALCGCGGAHPLSDGSGFTEFSIVHLNAIGDWVEPGPNPGRTEIAAAMPVESVREHLLRAVRIPESTTDVFIWIHGWMNDSASAVETGRKLFGGIERQRRLQPGLYPDLAPFVPCFIVLSWPSESPVNLDGYRTIRDRAARLSVHGAAEEGLAILIDEFAITRPDAKVHLVSTSFGGRVATAVAAGAAKKATRGVDTMTLLQLAAGERSFAPQLKNLVEPVDGKRPTRRLCLVHSRHDIALGLFHLLAEGERGVGFDGVDGIDEAVDREGMRPPDEPYSAKAFADGRILSVDASDVFGPVLKIEGAHRNLWHEETAHLLLSVAGAARGSSPPEPGRTTRGLAIAETVTVDVQAALPVNRTGIRIESGQRFTVQIPGDNHFRQQWQDGWKSTDGEKGWEPFWRLPLRRARRVPSKPWMSLIAEVGGAVETDLANLTPAVSGELLLFANDTPSGYRNNSGVIRVRVTRLD